MHAMVLSIIGQDKPGLVDDVAKAVANAQGNWLKSSFCQLGGHFAGFVEIMLPKDQHDKLVNDCKALSSLQITLIPAHDFIPQAFDKYIIKVTGNDRQGIVRDITGALKSFDVNIVELDTLCESAPNWGSPLFSASITVELQDGMDAEKLRDAIENIADDLMVDLQQVS